MEAKPAAQSDGRAALEQRALVHKKPTANKINLNTDLGAEPARTANRLVPCGLRVPLSRRPNDLHPSRSTLREAAPNRAKVVKVIATMPAVSESKPGPQNMVLAAQQVRLACTLSGRTTRLTPAVRLHCAALAAAPLCC